MRYTNGHKAQTRQQIIRSAGKLFAAKGFAATSIEEIMHDCQLTRGGFYAHFKSKSQLYRDAIDLATSQRALLGQSSKQRDASDWIELWLGEYLDGERADNDHSISHLAFLATDVASEEPEVRTAYANAFKAMSAQIANRTYAYASCDEGTILSMTAMIVGTLAIAQTIDDMALKTKLFASCRESVKTLLASGNGAPQNFFWEVPRERDYQYQRIPN